MVKYCIADLNSMPIESFIEVFGNVIEHSPVVVLGAFYKRPFINAADFVATLAKILDDLPFTVQAGILGIHPDLAGRMTLTKESTNEQTCAGLTSLGDRERDRIKRLNYSYRSKFGFPFVICARLNRKDVILEQMEKRLDNTKEEEVRIGINEVKKICNLRVKDLMEIDSATCKM